jgi:hypothetical protein
LKSSGILNEYPNLAAYVARGEARHPSFLNRAHPSVGFDVPGFTAA